MNQANTKINPMVVLFITLLITPLVGSSVDIFVPSLPYITHYFHASSEVTRLSVTVYLVSYGIFQLFAGSISDSFGRRNVVIVSLCGYVISSVMLPFSDSISHLLLWRVAQGIFCAGIGVVARTIIADTFAGKTLAKYAAYVTIAWAVGPILSPYLGGYLQYLFNWKASFYALAAYGFISLMAVLLFLPETNKHFHRFHIKPILENYRTIVSHKQFMAGSIICGLSYGVITLYNVVGPFLIETELGFGPVVYGQVALFLGLGWISGNFLIRLLVAHSKLHLVVQAFMIMFFILALLMLLFGIFSVFNLWSTSIPAVFLFVCAGVAFTYCFGKCLGIFPQMAGTAAAVMGSIFSTIAGLMSGIGSLLRADSLVPLSITYLILISVVFVIYQLAPQTTNQQNS